MSDWGCIRSRAVVAGGALVLLGTSQVVYAESMSPRLFFASGGTELAQATVRAGESITLQIMLSTTSEEIAGYSLDLRFSELGASIDQGGSGFSAERDIFSTVGLNRDSVFTLTQGNGFGGLFVNSVAEGLDSTGVTQQLNDVLYEIEIDIDADAVEGTETELFFGPTTVLTTAFGEAINFTSGSLLLAIGSGSGVIIPIPSSALLSGVVLAGLVLRRRPEIRRS
ncbi:MAG: hypothetical protein AAGB51_11855 [Planctomycetota bacterium]